jgi:hypothetical protein
MYISTTMRFGSAVPYIPNWARDCIICGRPSRGPCTECSAMYSPPAAFPTMIAKIAHGRLRPNTMARTPTEIARICTLLAAQKVNSVFGLPWRSSGGM